MGFSTVVPPLLALPISSRDSKRPRNHVQRPDGPRIPAHIAAVPLGFSPTLDLGTCPESAPTSIEI